MEFGPISVEAAEGATLAHSVRTDTGRIGKGAVLTRGQIDTLRAAGISTVIVAKLGEGDMAEDAAAAAVAEALIGPGLSISAPFTGRVNVFAECAGVLRVDASAVNSANRVDEAITLATLPDYARVQPRQMLATVKIIPYAAPADAVAQVVKQLRALPALSLHPRRIKTASVVLTVTPGMKPSLITKGGAVVAARLTALGVSVAEQIEVAHDTCALSGALAKATGEMILILGGSATSDRHDVGPSAVVSAGGVIDRFGMPVDPGNLLFLGQLGGRPVVGLPGCARSPKLNGADWVLERLVSGIAVSESDIQDMGVGGLLKEIPSRPQPRAGQAMPARPKVGALLLAAGSSSRMRGKDKLLETIGDAPLLTLAASALIASKVDHVIAVLRPDDEQRRAALSGTGVTIVENPLAEEGMGASIRAGMTALPADCDAVIIALADMPEIGSAELNSLIAAYDAEEGREIVRAATSDGRPGNPVLFGRRFLEVLRTSEGDEGARAVLAAHADLVHLLPMKAEAALTDLDTPEDWAAWRSGQA